MDALADFLLARIAEDEQRASLKVSEMQDLGGGVAFVPPGASYSPRVLADCEAKRTLVQTFDGHLGEGDGYAAAAELTLCALAAVYADHPDYDEAWRP